jgi:hypothetical protein
MGTPLREHPLMHRGPIPNWPPLWTHWTQGGGMRTIKSEVGVLRVLISEERSKKCFLVIEHEREHYVGSLLFDDSARCSQVCAQHLGQSIKEIGDLDVSFTT